MAKLVIGTNKQTVIPAVVRDMSPAHYVEKTVDANGKLVNSTNIINLNGVTNVGDNVLNFAYEKVAFPSGTNADLSSLTTISGNFACNSMFTDSSIASVNLSGLTTISGTSACQNMFSSCTSIASVNLSSLRTITGMYALREMFSKSAITNIDLSSLTICGSYACYSMFNRCSRLTSMTFSSLKELGPNACNSMFQSSSLATLYFPALTSNSFGNNTNQFTSMVFGVTGCSIHFPSNLDPQGGSTVVSSLSGYPSFGGTNTVLAFDLPATNHLIGADTVEYERSPKYDTATALAWRVNGTAVTATTYYTSGITNPQVNDTIYSDSACTQAVTTISSIA